MNFSGNCLLGVKGNSNLAILSAKADQSCISKLSNKLNQAKFEYHPWMSLDRATNLGWRIPSEGHLIPCASGLDIRGEMFNDYEIGLSRLDKSQLYDNRIVRVHDREFTPFLFAMQEILDLVQSNIIWKRRLEILVKEIIPQKGRDSSVKMRKNGAGLSSRKYRKGIFLSLPETSDISQFELALNLAHETGHQALMTYQEFDKIIKDSHDKLIYSVVRETKRPAILSFHAMVAVMFMLDFIVTFEKRLGNMVEENYLKTRKRDLQNQLAVALKDLRSLDLTNVGEQILREALALSLYSVEDVA